VQRRKEEKKRRMMDGLRIKEEYVAHGKVAKDLRRKQLKQKEAELKDLEVKVAQMDGIYDSLMYYSH
jgi:hypothetical protein